MEGIKGIIISSILAVIFIFSLVSVGLTLAIENDKPISYLSNGELNYDEYSEMIENVTGQKDVVEENVYSQDFGVFIDGKGFDVLTSAFSVFQTIKLAFSTIGTTINNIFGVYWLISLIISTLVIIALILIYVLWRAGT